MGSCNLIVVVTAEEMAKIDQSAIQDIGIPGMVLMENAGRGIAEIVCARLTAPDRRLVYIFCGPGNNGGDGFVIARYLINRGFHVYTWMLGSPRTDSDADKNLKILQKMGHQPSIIIQPSDLPLQTPDLIIDALLGTGAKGGLKGLYADVVNYMNAQQAPILSVDIPTGVDADSGMVEGAAVFADVTTTMALPKRGLLFSPGREHCGDLRIIDIAFPATVVEKSSPHVFWVEAKDIVALLPQRPPDAHKNRCGASAVIAGSRGFTGAAALTSQAALRVGAGLVYLIVAAALNDILEAKVTEVITLPLEDDGSGRLTDRNLAMVLENIQGKDAIGLGPGLGHHPQTFELVRQLLSTLDKPLVLDADGLNACAAETKLFSNYSGSLILTPHPGELSRLTGKTTAEINADRIAVSRQCAETWQCTVVLKGSPTVTATPDGRVFINSTGNAGMATAGSGDVLTGIICGLLAQGLHAEDAAIAGVYIHGLAGDVAKEQLTEMAMVAGDILSSISSALFKLISR
ncbi:MAG: NAD(P)H-hydrate dehydratase [Calditrichaeota bacterium]|nr:MAG: NAD(P)H-hydrate dehydratase [Calditrichota bacterium]